MQQSSNILVDAHTHIQDFQDEETITKVLDESAQANVKYIVVNSTTMDFLPKAILEYKGEYLKIIPCIGLHPWFVPADIDTKTYFNLMPELLEKYLQLQVGEIGLDFAKSKSKEERNLQKEIFKMQLEMAAKYQRTVSCHCVRAHGEMLGLLKKFFKEENKHFNETIVMHSYSGSKEIVDSLEKLYGNFYYTVSLNIVNKPEILNYVSIDKILLETDAPHQFNEKCLSQQYEFRIFKDSKATEPRFLEDLSKFCSDQLKMDHLEFKQRVFQNFLKAFQKFI